MNVQNNFTLGKQLFHHTTHLRLFPLRPLLPEVAMLPLEVARLPLGWISWYRGSSSRYLGRTSSSESSLPESMELHAEELSSEPDPQRLPLQSSLTLPPLRVTPHRLQRQLLPLDSEESDSGDERSVLRLDKLEPTELGGDTSRYLYKDVCSSWEARSSMPGEVE